MSCLDEVANVASHLLLIDDDLRLTEMVGGYLRQNGFEVSTAPTLSSGRVLLRQASFDALLLDLMPVSYTHLDVYKRQVMVRLRPDAGLGPISAAGRRG